MSLMNIALTLSRHTSNCLASILPLPFHYTLGLYNSLIKAIEEEKKPTEGSNASSSLGGFHMPSSMSFQGPGGTSSIHF